MRRTAQDYASLLRDLLPPGQAFRREPGTDTDILLGALAEEFARLDGRAFDLPGEVLPSTTTELLPDWERVAGLPDRCAGVLEDTQQGRRNALLAKLTSTGGQSIPYFISVAAALGFDITITEYRPFRAGLSVAGDALTNGLWRHVWRVNAPAQTVISFRAGLSAAGEPLASWGNAPLECKINQLKPAHTLAIFGYGAVELESLLEQANNMYYYANFTLPGDVQQ